MRIALSHCSSSIVVVTLLGSGLKQVEAQPKPVPNVVQGTVSTVDGRPVAGATIRVAGATGAARGTSITAKTDANGRYRVSVPLGHYNVDGFADVKFNGQTYKEWWLDRGDAPCERVMSDKGIVRNFVLRMSGPKRCTNGVPSTNPDAYYGAYITAMSSAFPDDAVITFTLTPTGPLADGTKGRTLVIKRTGAALKKGGGPIAETSFLHDIPLGRYNITATARYADGSQRATVLELRDGSSTSARALDIDFKANVFGGGIRSVGIGVTPGGGTVATNADNAAPPVAEQPADPATPAEPAVNNGGQTTSDETKPESAPTPVNGADLPVGRYACSYRSEYAGDIPTGKFIMIRGGGQYEAYGASGNYTVDGNAASVKWTGPLGGDVRATFGERNGLPAITVIGGGASEDPNRTNICVLTR